MKDNKTLLIIGGIVLVLLVAVFAFKSNTNPVVLNGNGEILNQNTITVSGSYEQEVKPDEAEIFIRVTTINADGQKAQLDNAKVTETLIDQIKKLGINSDDIETVNYNIQVRSNWDRNSEMYIEKGLEVTNTIKVNIKDFTKISKIIDTTQITSRIGETTVSIDNLQFTLSEEKQREVKNMLLSKASENAKTKAQAIANGLDVELGGIKSVVEQSTDYYPMPYYSYAEKLSVMADSAAASTPINPSTTTIRASVSIVFAT